MENEEKFCLKWSDFENNISRAFSELKDDEDFFDVTLACDGNQLQAHKVILSACSPFFRSILKVNKHPHPLLYLKGIKYEDMLSILDFMYHGEVNVAQVELSSFLAAAEDLQVKGLSAAGQEQHLSSQLMLDTKSSKQPEASIDISNYTNKPYKQPKINPISAQERPNTESANGKESSSVISVVKTESIVVDVDCDPLLTSNLQMEDQSMDWPAEEDGFGYQEQGKQAKQKGFVSNTKLGKILNVCTHFKILFIEMTV